MKFVALKSRMCRLLLTRLSVKMLVNMKKKELQRAELWESKFNLVCVSVPEVGSAAISSSLSNSNSGCNVPPGPWDRGAETLQDAKPAGVLQDCLFNTGISQLSSRRKQIYKRIYSIPAGRPCQRWQLMLWGFLWSIFRTAHVSSWCGTCSHAGARSPQVSLTLQAHKRVLRSVVQREGLFPKYDQFTWEVRAAVVGSSCSKAY